MLRTSSSTTLSLGRLLRSPSNKTFQYLDENPSRQWVFAFAWEDWEHWETYQMQYPDLSWLDFFGYTTAQLQDWRSQNYQYQLIRWPTDPTQILGPATWDFLVKACNISHQAELAQALSTKGFTGLSPQQKDRLVSLTHINNHFRGDGYIQSQVPSPYHANFRAKEYLLLNQDLKNLPFSVIKKGSF